MTKLKAKEISIFDIDKGATPTWENNKSRWFLIDNRFNGYSGWIVYNKTDNSREYAVLRNKDMGVMWMSGTNGSRRLEAMYAQLQIFEAGSRLFRS